MKSKFLIPLALFLGINASTQRFTDNDINKVCMYLKSKSSVIGRNYDTPKHEDVYTDFNNLTDYEKYTYGIAKHIAKSKSEDICGLTTYNSSLKDEVFKKLVANFGTPKPLDNLKKLGNSGVWESKNYKLVYVSTPDYGSNYRLRMETFTVSTKN